MQGDDVDTVRSAIWNNLPQEKKFSPERVAQITSRFRTVHGDGNSATVFRGTSGGSRVAVKCRKRGSEQGEKAFLTEIVVHSRMGNHPKIVGFLGCGLHSQSRMAYIVCEFMPNGSLESHIQANLRQFSWRRILQVLIDVATAISHLHSLGIAHRDIASRNILLDADLRGKLNDFGLCKLPLDAGCYFHEPVYPRIPSTLDFDVYRFGMVLFEVLHKRQCLDRQRSVLGWMQTLMTRGSHTVQDSANIQASWRSSGRSAVSSRSMGVIQRLAFRCVHSCSCYRPSISQVLDQLRHAAHY
ncbi:unnamed protein product [Cuscuta epithymum]|uniref:Protein kinase domain-containing protein n=1 Tax=Cuscuta epithymum TaxID=186058 RepID=A0AAV0DE67_9ASTE|nr:unnamed protein product [Cuscuta epithymum]